MEKLVGTLVIVLLTLTQAFLASAAVKVTPSVNPAVAGGTVTLSLSPPVTLTGGSWAVGESLILTWLGDQQAVFPGYSGRAVVNVTTGALTLSSLTVADSGVYVLQNPPLRASTSVTVVEPIVNVTVSRTQTHFAEFESSVVMRGSVSAGSLLSFFWMNNSSEVTASDRVKLTDGNSTLTIVNLTRDDSGPFRCFVINPVSNGTSDPVNLTVIYGPDNMALSVNGGDISSFSTGSNLTMLCSAESNPPAQLQWAFRGKLVNRTGTLLELSHVSEDQSGPYSCLAFNNYTNTHNNITTNVLIKSGSEQQAVNMLLLLAAFLLSLPGVGDSLRPQVTLME